MRYKFVYSICIKYRAFKTNELLEFVFLRTSPLLVKLAQLVAIDKYGNTSASESDFWIFLGYLLLLGVEPHHRSELINNPLNHSMAQLLEFVVAKEFRGVQRNLVGLEGYLLRI